MKLNIQKYVNNNKKLKSYGRTYGRIRHLGTIETLDLAKHIMKHGSIYTQDVIVGVLQRFSLCIEELLQDGYKVKLNGLGTFYLAVKTVGEENDEEFNASNIKQVRIRFLADRSKDYDWNSQSQTLRSSFAIEGKETAANNSGDSTTSGDESEEDRP